MRPVFTVQEVCRMILHCHSSKRFSILTSQWSPNHIWLQMVYSNTNTHLLWNIVDGYYNLLLLFSCCRYTHIESSWNKKHIHEGNYYIKPTINEQCHSLTHINGIISFHLETSTESTILCGTTHLYTIFLSRFVPEVFRFTSFYAQHHFLELCTKSQCFIFCSQQSS